MAAARTQDLTRGAQRGPARFDRITASSHGIALGLIMGKSGIHWRGAAIEPPTLYGYAAADYQPSRQCEQLCSARRDRLEISRGR
jgi:hypothetical protein